MQYTIWTKQGDKLAECATLQSVGDYIFTLPCDMLCQVYAHDITPCFYPYHTFEYSGIDIIGTQHETLNNAFKALA